MSTYTAGLRLKTERIVTKNDIVTLCMLLSGKDIYTNVCEFRPEGITEGGIVFKFKEENPGKQWYKTVRFSGGMDRMKWAWIHSDVISEWTDNSDIVFKKNEEFGTFLKSFNGAPLFTIDELKLWEDCFNKIGIVKVGKYPTEKSMKSIGAYC